MGKERMEAGRGGRKGVVKPAGRKGSGGKRGFYVLLAGVVVVGVAVLSWMASRSGAQVSRVDSTIAPIANQGHVLGSDSAPIEVVEFADFECPACGNFANLTEPDVRARLVNTGMIRFRFIDFPLDIHPNTWAAHSAAWCAGDQNRFWEMHDAIFQNQDRWSSQRTKKPEGVIRPLAQQIGLDMQKYDGCIESRQFHPQIRANYEEAIRRGVQSTPTFVIGTTQIPGVLSYDQFKKHVDQAIAAKASSQTAPATKR